MDSKDQIALGVIAAAAVGLAVMAKKGTGGGNPPPGTDPNNPGIIDIKIPSTKSGGTYWPTATLWLPPADSYRVNFQVNPQVLDPAGVAPVIDMLFATTISDPGSPVGVVTTLLNRSDNTYKVLGRGFIAKEQLTYDQGLYNAMIAAGQAVTVAYNAQGAAWSNVTAVEQSIVASWPSGWQDDPNWLYTHPYYSYPEWRAASDAAQAATDAWYAASDAYQTAINVFEATQVRTYERQNIPAQATVLTLFSYPLPVGSYPVIGSIFQTIAGVEKEFNFGVIGNLVVT